MNWFRHNHPFYIEIKFLTVVCSILYFYSPLSSLYEPNSIFTPFILCINIYISFKINIQGNGPHQPIYKQFNKNEKLKLKRRLKLLKLTLT